MNLQELLGDLSAFNKLTSIDLSGLGLTGTQKYYICHISHIIPGSLYTGAFPDELYQRLFSFDFFNFKGNNFDVDKKTIKGVFITEFTNIKDQTKINLSNRGLTGAETAILRGPVVTSDILLQVPSLILAPTLLLWTFGSTKINYQVRQN